jgi:phosphatidylglycerol---prolipoprotein diacylglyceryl transferase
MFPDLSYILHFLFGTEPDTAASIVKTFGLLLAIAFLASAWVLSLEMKRKTREGIFKPWATKVVEGEKPDIKFAIIQALIGFLIGYKGVYIFQNLDAFQADAAGVLLSTIGSTWGGLLGAVVWGGYQFYNKQKNALDKPVEKKILIQPSEMVGDITILAAISGVLGAKLFAIFESTETIRAFAADPIGQLFSGTGLAIYGGLIVAFFAVLYFIRKRNLAAWHMMDAAAPAMIMGYAVGRIGCQLSGDGDWGIYNTNPKPGWLSWLPDNLWVQTYPHNVINQGIRIPDCTWNYCMELSPGVYPTPIYETFMGLIIFGILWSLRKKIDIAGVLFFIYMILAGIQRFFIEKIRVNDKIHLMGIEASQAEIISVLFVIAGIAGIIYRVRKSGSDVASD